MMQVDIKRIQEHRLNYDSSNNLHKFHGEELSSCSRILPGGSIDFMSPMNYHLYPLQRQPTYTSNYSGFGGTGFISPIYCYHSCNRLLSTNQLLAHLNQQHKP